MEAVCQRDYMIRDTNAERGFDGISYSKELRYLRRAGENRRSGRAAMHGPAGSLSARGHRRLLFWSCGFCLISALLLLLAIFLTPAKKASAKNDLYETRLVSVKVEQGDSLWSIASTYVCCEKESTKELVSRIKQNNNLTGNVIYPDTYLLVQYYVKK